MIRWIASWFTRRPPEPEPRRLTPEEEAFVKQIREEVGQVKIMVRALRKLDRKTLEAWRDYLIEKEKTEHERSTGRTTGSDR
jgi:hypothetical protein